jgi:hypothetical protein
MRGTKNLTEESANLPGTVVNSALPKSKRGNRGIYGGSREVAVDAAELPGKVVGSILG